MPLPIEGSGVLDGLQRGNCKHVETNAKMQPVITGPSGRPVPTMGCITRNKKDRSFDLSSLLQLVR